MSKEKHNLIFIPGLGGSNLLFKFTVYTWKLAKFETHIFEPNWKSDETFESKLSRLLELVKSMYSEEGKISLIGTSAGGSLALNAFAHSPEMVNRAINICGRLQAGMNVSPTLEEASLQSSSFKDSVTTFEDVEPTLTPEQRKRIQTVRSFWDEVVPIFTMTLRGADNKKIISVEHMLSISLGLTVYALQSIRFLNGE